MVTRGYEALLSRIYDLAEKAGLDGTRETDKACRAVERYQKLLVAKAERRKLERMLGGKS